MSRGRTRARGRRARLEMIRAEFRQKREDPEAMAQLLGRYADSEVRVWAIARPGEGDRPLDEMERAMIAQTVAPPLAGMTSRSVHRRHQFSRRTRPATERDGFDLRLMSWGNGSEVPTVGKNMIVLGIDNKSLLHIRIFDAAGNRITDIDETQLPTQTAAIATLKQQLPSLLSPHVLTDAEKAGVIREATSIVGHTQQDAGGAGDVPGLPPGS
jgi:hypothetical protein